MFKKVRIWFYIVRDFLSRLFDYLPTLWHIRDFDYVDIYAVQQVQLIRLRETIINDSTHSVNWKYEVQRINLALRLLDIMIEDKDILELLYPNQPLFDIKDHQLVETNNKWTLTKYVNLRNASRFNKLLAEEIKKHDNAPILVNELYVLKVWYLYHKLLEQYARGWWT